MQGSGYLTACFSYATQPASYVLGVEKFEDVAVNSIHNLNTHNRRLLEQHAIDIRAGNIYDIVGAPPAGSPRRGASSAGGAASAAVELGMP